MAACKVLPGSSGRPLAELEQLCFCLHHLGRLPSEGLRGAVVRQHSESYRRKLKRLLRSGDMHALTGVACLVIGLSGTSPKAGHGTKLRPKASTGPASGGATGSRETNAVLNTCVVVAFWLGFESGSRRDQADTLVIGPSAEDAVDFGAALARDSIMLFWIILLSGGCQRFL
jgi:hypothetical protein